METPPNWHLASLGSALELLLDHRGKTPGKLGGEFVDAGVPAISAMNIKDGQVDVSRRERYVTTEMFERWMPERLRSGDVLMTSEAPLGSLAVVATDDPLVLSQRLYAFRGREGYLDNRYLRWFLESPAARRQLDERSSGSTVTGIRQAELRQILVPIAPIKEQHHIVAILEDHLSRLDVAEREMRGALTRAGALLTSGLWQATHGLADSVRRELQSVAEVRLGRQRSPKNHHGDRMRPYLRAANVGWDALRLDDVMRMQFTEAEEDTYRLCPGDILLTEASGSPAEVGKSVLYRGDPPQVCFQNTLIRVRCHSANPEFVQKYLLAEARAGRFMPEARGVGINHLGRAHLASLVIECPSEEAQARAVAECDQLSRDIARFESLISSHLKRAAALRRSLLAAAFSGRLTGADKDVSAVGQMVDA